MTASFIRELVRRAVLRAINASGELLLDELTLGAALDELLDERHALTRSILGGRPSGEPPPPIGPPPMGPLFPPGPSPQVYFGTDS